MTAEGRPEKFQQGRGIITGSIVGVIFSFSAVLIINIIGNQFLRIPTGQAKITLNRKDEKASINPRNEEFEMIEITYSGNGAVNCADGLTLAGPVSNGDEKIIICRKEDGQPFGGSNEIELYTINGDVKIESVKVDGQIKL